MPSQKIIFSQVCVLNVSVHLLLALQQLAVSVINILQNNNLNHLGNQAQLYLYGHRSLTSTDNRKILMSTIKYITDTTFFDLFLLTTRRPPTPPPPSPLQPVVLLFSLFTIFSFLYMHVFCF